MGVMLDGEPLTEVEVATLLAGTENLVLLRGQWVEVDRARLQRTMEQFHAAEELAARDGLTFAEAMRMLAGAGVTRDDPAAADTGWARGRSLVVSIPPVLLITLNGWRFIGLGFLMAYREGRLPGGFAWPAGLGDIAMAVTAPWFAARVAIDDRFRFSKAFLVWNLLGIADFLDAVFLGTLYLWPGFASSVNTALMQRLPFALIPCFFVPLVAMAHITLLEQWREGPNTNKTREIVP